MATLPGPAAAWGTAKFSVMGSLLAPGAFDAVGLGLAWVVAGAALVGSDIGTAGAVVPAGEAVADSGAGDGWRLGATDGLTVIDGVAVNASSAKAGATDVAVTAPRTATHAIILGNFTNPLPQIQ
jgi:hypothetical protein